MAAVVTVTLAAIRRATQEQVETLGLRPFARSRKINYGHLWSFVYQDRKPNPALLKGLGYRRVQTEVYERVR